LTARDLGVSDTSILYWKKHLEEIPENPFPGQGNPRDIELDQLRRENARLKEEVEILKKAMGIGTARPGEIPIHPAIRGAVLGQCLMSGDAGFQERLLRLV
jgi:hypothetical protein